MQETATVNVNEQDFNNTGSLSQAIIIGRLGGTKNQSAIRRQIADKWLACYAIIYLGNYYTLSSHNALAVSKNFTTYSMASDFV